MADTEHLNLYQKLAKIRKIVDIVKKDKTGYNYSYADINEILAKVKGGMEKYGVSLVPEMIHDSTKIELQRMSKPRVTKSGDHYEDVTYEYICDADMMFSWVNDENPNDKIMVPWHVVGSQSDPSQAFGSALTYSTRYFLLNYFQIAQDNDVDKYRAEQREAQDAENVQTAAEITKAFDLAARTFLSDHPDKKDAVNEFTTRYAKGGKFKEIKEPLLAAKMLEDFKNEFINKAK